MKKLILILPFLLIILAFSLLIIFRNILPTQLDDVNPLISCENEIISKSDTLLVIPIYLNKSISENITWCKEILSLNKTLGMHGVYHNYQEFLVQKDEEYIKKGMIEFEKCFGFEPLIFEAPQLAISNINKNLIKSMNLKFRGYFYTITHKVYHCEDTGKYSNAFISKF